jgi:hypothetical protein
VTDVVIVHWPGEGERREHLRVQGTPRLLLVATGASAPLVHDCLEDWVRVPVPEADIWTRVAALSLRAHSHLPSTPTLDDDGVLRHGRAWVDLPPVEARLARALLDRFGAVVGRGALLQAGWPARPPARNVLDVHILRLRRRVEGVGLAIRTVRGRGYLIEAASGPCQPPAPHR